MDQGEARKLARELGGIAVSARKGVTERWSIGGWPEAGDTWIVVSIDKQRVLYDGTQEIPVPEPIDDPAFHVLDSFVRNGGTKKTPLVAGNASPAMVMDLLARDLVSHEKGDTMRITDHGRHSHAMYKIGME